jgi:hypothetical protein
MEDKKDGEGRILYPSPIPSLLIAPGMFFFCFFIAGLKRGF